MKRIYLICIAMLISVSMFAQNQVKTYKMKSGYIKYNIGGSSKGTHEIWWDKYGDWKREEKNITTTTRIFGKKNVSKEHTVVITKGKLTWSADLEKNTGNKSINPMYDMMQQQMASMSEQEQEDMAMGVLGGLGGEKIGTGMVMGYQCDIIKAMGTKVWSYKNLPLKTESNMLGFKSSEEVTEFKPDSDVSTSKFEPLSNIDYKIEAGMEEEFEAALNNPDGVGAAKKVATLTYSYDKFKTIMEAYNPDGYMRTGPMNMFGNYTCIWQKSEDDMMAITVASSENNKEMDLEEMAKMDNVETFSHYGQTCYYLKPKSENSGEDLAAVLMIHYKSEKMIVVVAQKPDDSKQSLLKFYDKIKL